MSDLTHDGCRFGLATPLGKDVLLLCRFDGEEPMSGLFRYELEMLSTRDDIEAKEIIGQPVLFWVLHPDNEPRFFHCFVSQFRYIGHDDRLSRYRAEVVPWTWFLSLNSDCRIFQKMTIPDIIRKVLKDRGYTDFEDSQVRASYQPLEYCVQYNESDLAFISRLMEEAGIFYFFRHEKDRLLMVMADNTSACTDCKESLVDFADNLSERSETDQIWVWEHEYELRPGKWAHKDFNFKKPTDPLLTTINTKVQLPRNQSIEVYEFPGRFEDKGKGDMYAKIRLEAEEAAVDIVYGESYCRSFSPGARFRIGRHHSPRERNKSYIVTSVSHSLDVSDAFVTGSQRATKGYENRFTCIPATAPYRPFRKTPIPRVRGPQTAVIVGPPGEEIWPDEHGRVKVQFHWDREGKRDDNSSCWIRVSQVHAGQGWGMIDLPRIGEEVIVSFLEGDPDRPIITGRVYNGDNKVPYSLPENKTRRGNTTKTHKGAGYNEMTMDDTVGKEQLRMNAMYDMNSNVNNDQTLTVGKNQSESVGVDRSREVGNNEKVKIGSDRTVEVGSDHKESVGGSQTVDVGANQTTKIGGAHSVSVGSSQSNKIGSSQSNSIGTTKNETVGLASNEMVGMFKTVNVGVAMNTIVGALSAEEVAGTKIIVAGVSIAIQCGASSLTMDSGGQIVIKGTNILIDSTGPTKINGGPIDLN